MKRRRLWYVLGLILLGLTMWQAAHKTSPTRPPSPTGQAQIVRVSDGDTVVVNQNNKKTTIRLIGIDTPEVVDPRKVVQCFGHEASAKTKSLLPPNTVVKLELDPSQGTTDKYGRTLAYIYLPDGQMLNGLLVREGFAHEYTYHSNPYKYQAEFKTDEVYAREHELGLWNPTTCAGNTTQSAKS